MRNAFRKESIMNTHIKLSLFTFFTACFAMAQSLMAAPKTITWNNGSGSGEWNTTATNWTTNPYVDGDTVLFQGNNGSANTTIFIGLNGVPVAVSPATMAYNYSAGTMTFVGGDITGTCSIFAGDDGGFTFKNGTASGLSFSGGATAGDSRGKGSITYAPTNGNSIVCFGSSVISNTATVPGGTFSFNPSIPMMLTNRFNIISSNFTLNGNANALFGGEFHLGNNAGLVYAAYNGSAGQTVILDGATGTLAIAAANNSGAPSFNGTVSAPTAKLNLWANGNANTPPGGTWTDYRSGVTSTNAWNVKNVDIMGGILFVSTPATVFSLLRGNGGVVNLRNAVLAATNTVNQDVIDGTFDTGPVDYLIYAGAGGNNAARITANILNITAGGTINSGTDAGQLFGNTLNINNGSILGGVAIGGPKKGDGSLVKFTTVNLNPSGTLNTTGKVNAVALNLCGGTLLPNASTIWADTTTVRSAASTITATNNLVGNGLTRTTGATALFRGVNLGGSAKVTFTNGTTLTGGLFPWAMADASNTGLGTTFASYTANGFVPLAAYDALDTLSNTGNIDLTIANTIASGDPDRTNNALRLSSGGGVTINSPRRLTVTSGGIMALTGNTGFSGGTLDFGSSEAILHALGNLTISSAMTGTNGLTKDGAGTLTLSGANSLSNGATALNAGGLVLGANNALGTGAMTIQPGTVFDLAGFTQTLGGLSDNAGQALGGTVTNSGTATTLTINNSGSQTFTGLIAGNLALSKITGTGAQYLNASNSYSGGTTLSAGTLGVGNSNALGTGGLIINGGTIQANLAAQTITNALTVGGDFTIGGSYGLSLATGFQLTGNRQITNNNTGVTTIQGNITEDGTPRTFTKAGAGTLVLSGTCGWSGQTILCGGALRAAIPSCNLKFNGTTSDSPVWEASGTFNRNLGTSGATVQWTGTGGFAANGGPFAIQLNGGTAAVTWNSGSFVPTSHYLVLGSVTSDNVVDFQNAINLNGANRDVKVVDNPNSTNDYAILSGNISGSSTYTLLKHGNGTLRLTGNNAIGGVEAGDDSTYNGTIEFNSAAALGTGTIYGHYSSSLTLKNISGGPVTLPHSFASKNNNYSFYLAGNDMIFTGTISGSGGNVTLYAATGQTNTLNGPITGTPTLSTATGYNGIFILAPTAGTSGYINNLSGLTIGIASNNAFGVTTGAQFTDAAGFETFFTVGGNRSINSAIRWGGYNGVQTFNGSYNVTFSGDQNTPWNNSNNNIYWVVNAPLVTMSGIINESSCQNLHKQGAGVLAFTGNNTYTTKLWVEGGVFRYSGNGLSTNGALGLAGGVVESSGTFTRLLGASGGTNFQWTGSGGFSAFGGPLTVDINNDGAGASPLVWASTASFVGNTYALILSSTAADNVVTLVDNIDLNTAVRTIQVDDNTATSNDFAVINGILSGTGASGLNKTGVGRLVLNATNTYNGATTVSSGTLLVNGSLNSSSNGVVVSSGATLGGTGTIQRAVSVQTGGILRGGIPGVGGTLTISSNVTLAANSQVACDVVSGALSAITINGSLTLPTSATVTVNNVNGQLANASTMITANGGITGSITNWIVPNNLRLVQSGNQVILRPRFAGFVFMVD